MYHGKGGPRPRKRSATPPKNSRSPSARNATSPTGLGGHPFDLELDRLAPGHRVCPFHSHSAYWELFWITAGEGMVRADAARHTFTVGDVILHPPGVAREILNASATEPLGFMLIAENQHYEY